MPASLPVIINAKAGAGHSEEVAEKVRELFRAAGAKAQVYPARSGEELVGTAGRLAAAKPQVIVAGGGDGTVNAVASAIVGTQTALGILPMGTLNHFAKDLGVALDLAQAARDIVAGRTGAVDVGAVNGRIFVNNSSIGLYPEIVVHRDQQRRQLGRSKWHALFWAAVTVLRRSPLLSLRLCLDDRIEQRRASFVFIGNNVYRMEGFDIGSRERLDAGVLSLYMSPRTGRRKILGLAIRALFGLLRQADDFEAHTAQTIRLETRRRHLLVATDGEVTQLQAPLQYRIRPRALRVILPA